MARGTGTKRALSEADVAKLIRGDVDALIKQAATGGNLEAAPTTGPTQEPISTTAGPTPTTGPTTIPVAPGTPASTPPTGGTPPILPNAVPPPAGTPPVTTPPAGATPPATTPPAKKPNEEKKEERETKYVLGKKMGRGFRFGGSGSGYNLEGGAEKASPTGSGEAIERELSRQAEAKKRKAKRKPGSSPPTPPSAAPGKK